MQASELIDEMVASTGDWRGAILAKLRKIIHDADPGITEEVKWKRPGNPGGVAVFEHNGMVVIAGILKERVRLTFPDGPSLPDPQKLFNAMLEARSRAIDIYEGDKFNETALKTLIKAAVEHNLAKMKTTKPSEGTWGKPKPRPSK